MTSATLSMIVSVYTVGMEQSGRPQFNPEKYRDVLVDVVHPESVLRIVEGEKEADPSVRATARAVVDRLKELQQAGIPMRIIDNPSVYEPPEKAYASHVVAGAFDGQCIKDYLEAAEMAGVHLTSDPLLTVVLD